MRSTRLLAILCLSALVGLMSPATVVFAGPSGGTTLDGYKTASSTLTQSTTYNWSINKTTPPNQTPYVIHQGRSILSNFTIVATRAAGVVTSTSGPVTGQICVANTGDSATVGLAIHDVLQNAVGGNYHDIASQDVLVNYELETGESACYPYQFNIGLDPNRVYRNVAFVSIENYLGHEGTPWEIALEAPVHMTVTNQVIDATAALTDVFQCPAGFSCQPLSSTQTLTNSQTISYQVQLQNLSAPCGQTLSALNSATLVQSTTLQTRASSASIQIYTGTCHR
ncbi:hypothetical protein WDW37_04830 [Bdellovibrionota bacterium FG-1]